MISVVFPSKSQLFQFCGYLFWYILFKHFLHFELFVVSLQKSPFIKENVLKVEDIDDK